MAKRIAIGADHGGFLLKEKIKKMLKKARYKVDDVGTFSGEMCDYPCFGALVAREVSRGKANRGILICKTGIGMAIIANKYRGVRAGVCSSQAEALSARRHNDVNILVLAATKLTTKEALDITKVWLKTRALRGRHARRVKQIKDFEKKIIGTVPR